MHETKSKWFKKVLRATLCFLVVCGSLSAMLFVPNKRGGNTTSPHRKGTLCLLCAASSVAHTYAYFY